MHHQENCVSNRAGWRVVARLSIAAPTPLQTGHWHRQPLANIRQSVVPVPRSSWSIPPQCVKYWRHPLVTAQIGSPRCTGEFLGTALEKRAQGMPGARRAPAALRANEKSTQVSHHRYVASSDIPCAMVLTRSFVVSPENRALLSPSSPRSASFLRT